MAGTNKAVLGVAVIALAAGGVFLATKMSGGGKFGDHVKNVEAAKAVQMELGRFTRADPDKYKFVNLAVDPNDEVDPPTCVLELSGYVETQEALDALHAKVNEIKKDTKIDDKVKVFKK